MEINKYFFIGINVPSSKNNKQWTGSVLIPSARVLEWKENTKIQWLCQKQAFLDAISALPKPLYIEFTFIRKGKHRFDYVNPLQTLLDEMVHYGWIEDDNANIIKPFFGDYIYDKENHGCLIRVLKSKPII